MSRNLAMIAVAALVGLSACSDPESQGSPVQVDEAGNVTITDRTGKVWDVSHAVTAYDFVAEGFQFGLGPGAIPPVFDPTFFEAEDAGFPAAAQDHAVIGVTMNGESRAYSVQSLSRREVINDKFGNAHVTVAY